jgi:roadblock/LC7 domain-containing protein
MRIYPFIILFLSLFISQFSFAAACPISSVAAATGAAFNSACTVTGSASAIQLKFKNGFNDPLAVAASGGNNGTTIGAQRKLSFIKAAEILSEKIISSQTIIIDANFDSKMACSAFAATLGSAGATTNITGSRASSDLLKNTFYPIGLANAISNKDLNTRLSDIGASFNADLGDANCLSGSFWYYGFDAPSGTNIGFTTVLLHEIIHGLGFASLTDASSGAKPSGLNDIFSNFLYSAADGANWAVAGGLTNRQRAASAISDTGLLWNGSHVNTAAEGVLNAGFNDADASASFTTGDRVQMYAPNPIVGGSSVSHFDTAASPDEIMEPQYTAGSLDIGLASYLLKDIGWKIAEPAVDAEPAVNAEPTIIAIAQSTTEDAIKVVDASRWGNDTDGDTLTYSISRNCAPNITCIINPDGTNLSMIPAANHNGGTHSILINVSDGKGGSASDTFNLNVSAQNDAPVISGIPNQTIEAGQFKDINLIRYASDIDNDGLSFFARACGANLSCSFPNATTIRIAAIAGGGSTVAVTVEANDNNGGTNTDTFTVSITAVVVRNNAPTIRAVSQSTREDVTKIVNASRWGNDIDGDTLTYSIRRNCAPNITCRINSDGTNLTMTPAANHNGGTHSILINVSDGKGGSASDTFNLNVSAQNDAPVISGIPNQTIEAGQFKDINLIRYASDIDNDGLSFFARACGANLSCSFPNATTIRIAAIAGGGSTVAVTVEANDNNGGTNTDTFTVSITSPLPSTTVEVGGSTHNDGDTFILSDSRTQINVNNGSGDYRYSLNYNSSDVSRLITSNATGLTIALPTRGEFAGDYSLIITDKADGDVIRVTIKRPLRLILSTEAFLNGDVSQTLKIEGGAAGTVYSLVQSGNADLIFRDSDGSSVTTALASADADRFNAALVHLDSLVVASISSMDVTVQSRYDDVVATDIKVYPSARHSFVVKNSSDDALGTAIATLNGGEALLAELSVITSYETDVNGRFSILLPDTSVLSAGSSYAMSVSLTGYSSINLVLNSENTIHDVVLIRLINSITLIGEINVQGSQNLLQQPPVVTISYGDGTADTILVEVTSATRASFRHEVDLNLKSLQALSIRQTESIETKRLLSNITESQSISLTLLGKPSITPTALPTVTPASPSEAPADSPSEAPADSPSGPSGGSLFWFSFLWLVILHLGFSAAKKLKE